MFLLGLLYFSIVIVFGFLSSCICCFPTKKRALFIFILWTIPFLFWITYSPLNVCENRIIYSFPADHDTNHDNWIPFWCSRKCDRPVKQPVNVEQLQNIVLNHNHIRVVGGGHSSTELQCPDENGINVVLNRMCQFYGIENNVATFSGGCTVKYAQKELLKNNFELHGFGGIVEQTLAGSISTYLHGQHLIPFSNHLTALKAVLANGSTISVSKTDEYFYAWPGSHGTLGIIYEVSFQVFNTEFVECSTNKDASELDFENSLQSENIVGFEAKRLLSNDHYTVKTCVSSSQTDTNVIFEEKDNIFSAFLMDNIAIGSLMLIGGLFRAGTLYENTMQNIVTTGTSQTGIVPSINDFRVAVSFNPHFDEEYTVPIKHCLSAIDELKKIQEAFGDPIHIFIRRIDNAVGFLNWSPIKSCAIRLEYFDYRRYNFIDHEISFRKKIETLMLSFNGSSHIGKLFYSNAKYLMKTSNIEKFESYRYLLDPNEKFQNSYTKEIRGLVVSRNHETLPKELETRRLIFKVVFFVAFGLTILQTLFTCVIARKKRINEPNIDEITLSTLSVKQLENKAKIRATMR